MMADLAQAFHWPPSELKAMDLHEMIMWHAEAVSRNKQDDE